MKSSISNKYGFNSEQLDELEDIGNSYDPIADYVNQYNCKNFIEFDYYISNKSSLFYVHENYDFDAIEAQLMKINNALPAIKRIFAKPIIHLKEENEVLPCEAVRLINNDTINHIAMHSELWSDVNEDGVRPNKLLTRTYRDNYSIYENILFTKTIDTILHFMRKNMKQLKSLMYSSKNLEFNLLERVNHINYFLAVGKLHTGYIRNYAHYYDKSMELYPKFALTNDVISSRLKRNVYRLNKNKLKGFRLHNSNILHMQRDYHKVYVLLKFFDRIKETEHKDLPINYDDFVKGYYLYLKIIILFAVIHFNFEIDKEEPIDFVQLENYFTYKGWKLHVYENDDRRGINLSFRKDKKRTISIYPVFNKPLKRNDFVVVSPFYSDKDKCTYISNTDIESFRRIQQILLRGMIECDDKHDVCPFCGNSMTDISDKEQTAFKCNSCNTVINERECEITHEKYFTTTLANYRIKDFDVSVENSELYHYRNITKVNTSGEMICPECGKVHDK